MKKILLGTLLCFVVYNSFGQSDELVLHTRFLQYIKAQKIDSIYNSYSEVDVNDEDYEKALLYRNQHGWVLNKVEELRTDFSAIIKLPSYSQEMAYMRVFEPQEWPPSEWNAFLEIAIVLETSFDTNSNEYRELLGIKTKLEFIMQNEEALRVDIPKLLKRLDKGSEYYSALLLNYGKLLIRDGNEIGGEKVFIEGLSQENNDDFLNSLIHLYSMNKDYDKVIKYKDQILGDSSGRLLFILGEAYRAKTDKENARESYNLYISKFIYSGYDPFVKIEYNNTVGQIAPSELEILGDFFLEKDKKQSCKFYQYAERIIENSSADRFFNKRLMAIKDETQKKEMAAKFKENKREQQELLTRVQNKLKTCK